MTKQIEEVKQIIADESTCREDAAVRMLRICLDFRLESDGGYPAVIDNSTFPGRVLVADVDHDEAPSLTIFDLEELMDLLREAIEAGSLPDEETDEPLMPDRAAEAVLDHFASWYSDCVFEGEPEVQSSAIGKGKLD